MDLARVGRQTTATTAAVDIVHWPEVARVRYEVGKLPEKQRPYCIACGEYIHLYDVQKLLAGVTRPVTRKKGQPNPGFIHYEANPDCPYSGEPNSEHFADLISDTVFDQQEIEFNRKALATREARATMDAVTAYFIHPYTGSREITADVTKRLEQVEKKYILPMKGIGSAVWFAALARMFFLPDILREFKSGNEATVGFRGSIEKNPVTFLDSAGNQYVERYPRHITLGYIPKRRNGKKDINPMMWFGNELRLEVSEKSVDKICAIMEELAKKRQPRALVVVPSPKVVIPAPEVKEEAAWQLESPSSAVYKTTRVYSPHKPKRRYASGQKRLKFA
jgi:hypothetical protein